MTHAVRIRILALCLAVLPAGPAFTQIQSSAADPAATVTAADVAYVYVGTSKGVYLYDAASNGKLTLVSGSPFKIAGTAAGSNGKYFLTSDTDYVHSYSVASNGAIGQQKSEINTQNYYGSDCGVPIAAVLDHTGQNLYVELNPSGAATPVCVAYQTFDISQVSGALTSNGAAIYNTDYPWQGAGIFAFAITGNDQFAYATNSFNQAVPALSAFRRASDGSLAYTSFNEIDPPLVTGANSYIPFNLTEDPTNHLAVGLVTTGNLYQLLVSYTVDGQGNIVSTNTPENIPNAQVYPTGMQMSPSGDLLAISSDFQSPSLQIFHFNGAGPITVDRVALNSPTINEIRWDKANHLYAISNSANKMYVFTVTPTSFAQAPGSPYTIDGANALVVVSNVCSAPTSPGVHICLPVSGSSTSSPVLVEAASKVTGTIVSTQLWVDGVKNFNAPGSTTLTTSVSLAAGSHRFAVIATNTAGQKWESTVSVTVK